MIENIKIGDKIGEKFIVKVILGGEKKSSMGIIYICQIIENGGLIALKTFQDQFIFSEDMKEEFRREALAWINLDKHANIVTANSFDIIDKRPFIFIEPIFPDDMGRNTLEDHMNTEIEISPVLAMVFKKMFIPKENNNMTYIKPLLFNLQILDWAIQFCHGMEHAISRGISAHRDIKPDNIMITEDKILKITDFGLAKIWDNIKDFSKIEDISNEILEFLKTDKIKTSSGTPRYMAPEHFEGKTNEISDLYSFGVVLYQICNNGCPPFIFDENDPEYWYKYYSAHKNDPIKKIESDIFPIIKKCLEKNQNNRYRSFKELRNDLEALYKKITGINPLKPPKNAKLEAWEHLNKGYAFKKLGFTDSCISELEKSIDLDSKFYLAHQNLGIILIELKQYEKAKKQFEKVIQIKEFDKAHYNLAICLYELKEFEKSIDHYDEAIRINPNCKQAYVNKGKILMDLELINDAISEFKNALRIDPNFFPALMNLGQALEDDGKHDEAIIQYEYAHKIEKDDPGLYNSWGVSLSSNGDEAKAIMKYIKSIDLKPDFSEAHNNLGISFMNQGKAENAIHEFKESIKHNRNNVGSYNSLGIALASLDEYESSISELEKAANIDPEHIITKENLIQVRLDYASYLLDQKKYLESAEQCKQAINIEPDNIAPHGILGDIYINLDKFDKAIHEYDVILNIDPMNKLAIARLKLINELKDPFPDTA